MFVGDGFMPKARTNFADDYETWVKLGRGQGEFKDYVSWLTVRDVKSPVGCSRIWSRKLQRVINVLSFGEAIAFYILEWQNEVADVREQFPLDPANTRDICKEMRLIHPGIGGRDIVMTTDFLVTYKKGDHLYYKAIQVKDSKQTIMDPRTNSKLQIERKYWERKGIPFAIWLSSDFSPILKSNFKLISGTRNILTEITDDDRNAISELMKEITATAPELPYSECSEIIELHGYPLRINDCLRMLVAWNLWHFPMSEKPITSSLLKDFTPIGF